MLRHLVTGDPLNLKKCIRSDSELAALRRRKKAAVVNLWISTSDAKDEEESARLWSTSCLTPCAVYAAISSVSLSIPSRNLHRFRFRYRLHLKVEKLDTNKWPVGSARLENIVYVYVFSLLICSLSWRREDAKDDVRAGND
ncbi:hypothetical protein IW262DRAFT_1300690 [Armillaria fumosa]|nr:hypothetical protein IW262DRAFT_1300690 [Armillaria fumosa]